MIKNAVNSDELYVTLDCVSFRVAAAPTVIGHFGSVGLSDCPALPAQEEKAKRQSNKSEDPKRKP